MAARSVERAAHALSMLAAAVQDDAGLEAAERHYCTVAAYAMPLGMYRALVQIERIGSTPRVESTLVCFISTILKVRPFLKAVGFKLIQPVTPTHRAARTTGEGRRQQSWRVGRGLYPRAPGGGHRAYP